MADDANPMGFRIRRSGAIIGVPLREQNDIARQVAKDAADYWYDNFLEKHFTHAGAAEYGYKPRNGERDNPGEKGFWASYTGRKLKKWGHTRPLMWTGDSYEWLKSRKRFKITATGGQAKARIMLGAPNFNWHNPNSQINMDEEITTVSDSERATLLDLIKKRFVELYTARRAALK